MKNQEFEQAKYTYSVMLFEDFLKEDLNIVCFGFNILNVEPEERVECFTIIYNVYKTQLDEIMANGGAEYNFYLWLKTNRDKLKDIYEHEVYKKNNQKQKRDALINELLEKIETTPEVSTLTDDEHAVFKFQAFSNSVRKLSYSEIADTLELYEFDVIKILKRLTDKGFVTKTPTGYKCNTNFYYMSKNPTQAISR